MSVDSPPKEIKQKALIVDPARSPYALPLKKELHKYGYDIYSSPELPRDTHAFQLLIVIGDLRLAKRLAHQPLPNKTLFLLPQSGKDVHHLVSRIQKARVTHIKIVTVDIAVPPGESTLSRIFWFLFSSSDEVYLLIHANITGHKKTRPNTTGKPWDVLLVSFLERVFKPRVFLTFFLLIFFVYHLSFVPPLILGSYGTYRAVRALQSGNMEQAIALREEATPFFAVARALYGFSRPSYLLFSLARIPDDAFQINDRTLQVLLRLKLVQGNASHMMELIMKKNKTPKEKDTLRSLFTTIRTDMNKLEEDALFVNQKIPSSWPVFQKTKNTIIKASDILAKVKKIYAYIPTILADNTEKKYLILFANNMELRPGGGFIGSFGILTVGDLTIRDLKIYDVYDADGQLTAHIDPPPAIRKYLNQPHWFLRDSAFSPDFYDNYYQAKFFIEKEMNITGLSGGILLTTTTVKNMLESYGEIYLPGFQERINKDNFYLKTQLHAEDNFFPGSTQKKSFLGSLATQLFVSLDSVSPEVFLSGIIKSVEEKQLVMYFEDEDLQKNIDALYWSGRIIEPHCPPDVANCYTDYLYPYDANLGINKTNAFISRSMRASVSISDDGFVETTFTEQFKNEALSNVYPGGTYQNYFQLLLPRDAIIVAVRKDGALFMDYDKEVGQFRKIGLMVSVAPQSFSELSVTYKSPTALKKGRSIYQLLVQKQTGSTNSEFALSVHLPQTVYMTNQNFTPLVKPEGIIYNTDLSADKIFFIELLKE